MRERGGRQSTRSNGGTLKSLRVTRLDAESGIVYVELRKHGLSFEAHTSESEGFILSTVVSEIKPQSHQ